MAAGADPGETPRYTPTTYHGIQQACSITRASFAGDTKRPALSRVERTGLVHNPTAQGPLNAVGPQYSKLYAAVVAQERRDDARQGKAHAD